jgi:23S rRNA (guanosine2251-2'-O)-methyltransferase
VTSQSAIAHLLAHRPRAVRRLRVAASAETVGRVAELLRAAARAGVPTENVAELVDFERNERRVPLEAWVAPPQPAAAAKLVESLAAKPRATVLILDHLQDPQNFGAICRTAEGLGVDGVFVPRERTVPITAGVFAASAGAVATLSLAEGNLGDCARRLKDAGFWIITASVGQGAEAPWRMPDFEKVALVLGAEWKGVSPLLEKLADWRVEIPITGKIESLNVGVAAAVLLYERFRRTATAADKQ